MFFLNYYRFPAFAQLNNNAFKCTFKPKGNVGSDSGPEIPKCISHDITLYLGVRHFYVKQTQRSQYGLRTGATARFKLHIEYDCN